MCYNMQWPLTLEIKDQLGKETELDPVSACSPCSFVGSLDLTHSIVSSVLVFNSFMEMSSNNAWEFGFLLWKIVKILSTFDVSYLYLHLCFSK